MPFPLFGLARPQLLDGSGNPLANGSLLIYGGGTTTKKASYPTLRDADRARNANLNPIRLNARGEPDDPLWGLDNEDYKAVLKDSSDSTIWTIDDIRTPITDPSLYGVTAQTLTDAGAVSLTESTTFIVTTTASALTLANGTESQRKFIVMKTDAGDATLTPDNFADGDTIVFDDVGDSADLLFANSQWHFLGGTARVTGASTATRKVRTVTSTDAEANVNNGTPVADPYLKDFHLDAGTYYAINGWIWWSIIPAAASWSMSLNTNNDFQDAYWALDGIDEDGGGTQVSDCDNPTTAIAAHADVVRVRGFVLTHKSSPSNVDLMWNATGAGSLWMGRGSWLEFERIDV